jgi:pimeloyl-ACP methyl ester carboxylesterase
MLEPSGYQSLQVDHAWAESGRIKTHFISAGSGDPLILLHGAGGDGSNFTSIIPELAISRTVIAPDLPGHGRSDGLDGLYTVAVYLRWLDAFIDSVVEAPVELIGHSMGGSLALRYASQHPDKVKRLVLVDSIALGLPDLSATLKLLVAVFTPDEVRSRDRMGEVMFAGDATKRRAMVAAFLGPEASPQRGMRGFLWMFSRTWHLAAPISDRLLKRLQIPVLILWGDSDTYFSQAHARRAQRLIPRSWLALIPNAGHAPFLEQPEQFLAQLKLGT